MKICNVQLFKIVVIIICNILFKLSWLLFFILYHIKKERTLVLEYLEGFLSKLLVVLKQATLRKNSLEAIYL